ncbi:hypothetical protein AAA733_003563 [Providencia rettgeri]
MAQLDAVTEYLYRKGKQPQKAFFNNSSVFIGWKVEFTHFELTYRLNDKELIICDFSSTAHSKNKRMATISFIKFIHELESCCFDFNSIRGLLLASPNPEVTELRERLAQSLLSQGAEWEMINGDNWLVYLLNKNRI